MIFLSSLKNTMINFINFLVLNIPLFFHFLQKKSILFITFLFLEFLLIWFIDPILWNLLLEHFKSNPKILSDIYMTKPDIGNIDSIINEDVNTSEINNTYSKKTIILSLFFVS